MGKIPVYMLMEICRGMNGKLNRDSNGRRPHKKLKLEETESTKWVCKEDVRVKGRFMNIFRIR